MSRPLRILLLAFDEVEALDLAGPYEVFTTAARMAARTVAGSAPAQCPPEHPAHWQVACVSRDGRPVRARAGLQILPEHGFSDAPQADLLLVPGGVVDAAARCPETLAWVGGQARQAQIAASVCTGVFILAAAAVLSARQNVTTHWEDIDALQRLHPGLQVQAGPRWIDEGRIVSSAGISAGIDMSLHLVERLGGLALAERTARQMDYRWLKTPA
ncbi:MAG: DJ-1/PfpI family protein [Curvibacter sp.]|nr:DJ-1/PfpI family protein [Curvibacter sp.]